MECLEIYKLIDNFFAKTTKNTVFDSKKVQKEMFDSYIPEYKTF